MSRHPIPVRPVSIPFDESIPRHWLHESPLETHFFNGLNLLFPDGERFFIEAVRDHLDRVTDEELRRQARGFFGQEARHAREHERYFEILEGQGYRVRPFLARFRRYVRFMQRWLPAPLRLSVTAAAEHYTAAFGAIALRERLVDSAHPAMRQLILWHAAEEIEHKAVAFDVLRATHPSYALRVLGFALATASLFGWALAGMRMLLRQDGVSRAELETLRAEAARRHSDGSERGLGRHIRSAFASYLRRDFHPDEQDDLPLARERLAEIGLSPKGQAA